jgi:DNA-binding response OmpR family regulator
MIQISTAPKGELGSELGVDLGTYRCGQCHLTRREHQILNLLNRNFGLMVPWDRLVDMLYEIDEDGGPDNPKSVLSVTLCALRRKLLCTGYEIVTVHCEGLLLKYRPFVEHQLRAAVA